MLCEQGHDDRGIFAALRFVNTDRIGQREFVGFAPIVLDCPIVNLHCQRLILQIDPRDISQIAVVDVFIVVVARLQHPIAQAEERARQLSLGFPGRGRIQFLLQLRIQRRDAGAAAIHGREDLNVRWFHAEFVGNARADQIDDQFGGFIGVFFDEEEEIVGFFGRERHLPAMDAVRVGDDVRVHGLPEDHVEADDGGPLGGDDIAQHVARAHAGQLVDVADQQQMRVDRHGFEQVVHQQ